MTREVDRLLAQLDRKQQSPTPRRATPAVAEVRPEIAPATIVWASTPVPVASPPPASPAPIASVESPAYERTALWGRVVLGASLGILMTNWPYAHDCGWALLGYSAAVVTVLITGAWIALAAWKQHSGPAHIFALILFYWGLVLAAEQVLPRVGYGWLNATWTCSATPASW